MEAVQPLSEYELERGKPMPSKVHSFIQTRLATKLSNRYEDSYDFFTELSLELSTGKSVPDVCIYSKMEIDMLHDEVRVKESPLGVIEILSPRQILNDIVERASQYFDAGVKSFWVVIPTFKTIYVFRDANHYTTFADEDTLQDDALNITLPLTEIFPA